MPVLESPEVNITYFNGGTLIRLEQTTLPADQVEQYHTDTGLTGPLGMNPLCTSIHLHEVSPGTLTMAFYLSGKWEGKNNFIDQMMDKHGVAVVDSVIGWDGSITKLSVMGAENILKVGAHLRSAFEVSKQEGADIFIPLVHPAILGEAMDKVLANTDRNTQKPGNGWGSVAKTYGWRL